ncbi:hypothetical protein Pcinc_004762 [Petrolisthes cinctipes]|uniref:Uncharacterized protein n=1 Tax=Petrolisthes cinctipes TaxID=88211 RepID=A0AAE1GKQ3_PETCI|nr:hypothetical protein Pcinc_004762 [Petrolisthes cinctipes]
MYRKCKNYPDRFCYISGHVVLPDRRAKITDFVKKSYHAYFGVKLEPDVIMESSSNPESSDAANSDESGAYKPVDDDQPMPLIQAELNDLTRDLNLSKESAQLLGSRIREKCLLAPETTFYWYRDREREFLR